MHVLGLVWRAFIFICFLVFGISAIYWGHVGDYAQGSFNLLWAILIVLGWVRRDIEKKRG